MLASPKNAQPGKNFFGPFRFVRAAADLFREVTKKEAEEAKRQKEAAARERAREDLQIITIQGTSAAIAIGEATARAVQRIPDAHCNGDMHAALDYAAKIKHAQKDFLTSQGIHAIID